MPGAKATTCQLCVSCFSRGRCLEKLNSNLPAAALVVDGVPVCAVQEERLSRRKSDASFPLLAIEWCLDHAGLEPQALDAVVFYERPMLKFERILTCALRAFPRSWRSFPKAMQNSLGEKIWVRGIIS